MTTVATEPLYTPRLSPHTDLRLVVPVHPILVQSISRPNANVSQLPRYLFETDSPPPYSLRTLVLTSRTLHRHHHVDIVRPEAKCVPRIFPPRYSIITAAGIEWRSTQRLNLHTPTIGEVVSSNSHEIRGVCYAETT